MATEADMLSIALLNQIRHRQRKVLTNQIVSGITEEDANKDLPTKLDFLRRCQ
jgi:hypothetical protein